MAEGSVDPDTCAAAVGCAASCWTQCWRSATAPPCAVACAAGDQAYLLLALALAPYLGRLTVEYFLAASRGGGGKNKKKRGKKNGKKGRKAAKEEYEEVEPANPGLTMATLIGEEGAPDWEDAVEHLRLAGAQAAGRLLFWHVAQPLFFIVAFQASAPQLTDLQWWLGAAVGAREALHLVSLLGALLENKAFLLLDVPASVKGVDAENGDDDTPGFATGNAFLALYTLSPEVFLTLAWSRAADKNEIGDGVMALGFLCNLGGVAALAYGAAADDLPPLPLMAVYVLAAAAAALAILLAKHEEDAEAAAAGGAAAFVAVGTVAWCLGSGALDLAILTETSPVGLPWWQAILVAVVLLGFLVWKKLNGDDDDSDSDSDSDDEESGRGRSRSGSGGGRKKAVDFGRGKPTENTDEWEFGDECEVHSVSQDEWYSGSVVAVDLASKIVTAEYDTPKGKMKKLIPTQSDDIRKLSSTPVRAKKTSRNSNRSW